MALPIIHTGKFETQDYGISDAVSRGIAFGENKRRYEQNRRDEILKWGAELNDLEMTNTVLDGLAQEQLRIKTETDAQAANALAEIGKSGRVDVSQVHKKVSGIVNHGHAQMTVLNHWAQLHQANEEVVKTDLNKYCPQTVQAHYNYKANGGRDENGNIIPPPELKERGFSPSEVVKGIGIPNLDDKKVVTEISTGKGSQTMKTTKMIPGWKNEDGSFDWKAAMPLIESITGDDMSMDHYKMRQTITNEFYDELGVDWMLISDEQLMNIENGRKDIIGYKREIVEAEGTYTGDDPVGFYDEVVHEKNGSQQLESKYRDMMEMRVFVDRNVSDPTIPEQQELRGSALAGSSRGRGQQLHFNNTTTMNLTDGYAEVDEVEIPGVVAVPTYKTYKNRTFNQVYIPGSGMVNDKKLDNVRVQYVQVAANGMTAGLIGTTDLSRDAMVKIDGSRMSTEKAANEYKDAAVDYYKEQTNVFGRLKKDAAKAIENLNDPNVSALDKMDYIQQADIGVGVEFFNELIPVDVFIPANENGLEGEFSFDVVGEGWTQATMNIKGADQSTQKASSLPKTEDGNVDVGKLKKGQSYQVDQGDVRIWNGSKFVKEQ
jgi:hypothetical protein